MKILSLALKHYERMRLRDIDEIQITLNQPFQFIVGTNGSGKSSLLEELSPLPAHKSNYRLGGYKIIRIEHQDQTYRLSSHFDKIHRHSFYNETTDTELNQGGTYTQQKQLCTQVFHLDEATHKLLLGLTRWTSMDMAQRDSWLTQMADADYSYALSVYEKLQTRRRDLVGNLRYLKKQLITEQSQQLDHEAHKDLQGHISDLKLHIQYLYQHKNRQPVLETFESLTEANQKDLGTLKTLAQKHRRARRAYRPSLALLSQDVIRFQIEVTQDRLNQARQDHEQALTNYSAFEQHIQAITREGEHDLQSNLQRQQALATRLMGASITQLDPIPVKLTTQKADFEKMYRELSQCFSDIQDLVRDIPDNPEHHYRSARIQKTKEDLEQTQAERRKLQARLDHARVFLLHQEEARDGKPTTCPNCEHVWHQNYQPERYQKALARQAELLAAFEALETKQEHLQAYLTEAQVFFQAYRQYTQFTKHHRDLQWLWDYLEERTPVHEKASQAQITLQQLSQCLQIMEGLYHDLIQYYDLREVIEIQSKSLDEQKGSLYDKVSRLKDDVDLASQKLIQTQTTLKRLEGQLKVMVIAETAYHEIVQLKAQLDHRLQINEQIARDRYIDQVIEKLTLDLAQSQSTYNQQVEVQRKVRHTEAQIQVLTQQQDLVDLLIHEISPKTGLIGYSLIQFINRLIHGTNLLLGHLWTYPMALTPYDPFQTLDYRLPVVVDNKIELADIQEGSSAMKSVFDFALMMLTRQYLGLSDYPIYLDEMGKEMDHEHRLKIIQFLKTYQEAHPDQQILLVSHDILQYSAIHQAEICVLCDENVILPAQAVFNQHVQFN